MARAGAGGLNVGRAALLIVVALMIGIVVLNQDNVGNSTPALDVPNETVETATTSTTRRLTTPTTVALRPANSFKTIAINATNTSGVAARATTKLNGAGYNAVAPDSAPASVKAATKTSAVLYAPGFEREAQAVAALFQLPATAVRALTTPHPSTAVKDASVVLLVGPDLKI